MKTLKGVSARLLNKIHYEEISKKLQDDIEKTISRSIMATPTIEINGVIYTGAMPYDVLVKEIKLAKKRANN